ncbi:MAG TPA: PqqD family peptide modification chaperone [Caulobacteraceae bacterium]|nr:PqqD family peptide modification chaperone [Caulobacteraceae bacterium]
MAIRRNGEWLTATVDSELVMMSAASGHYVGLSEVGARIWELIEPPLELDALCARLVEEFDVTPQACRADVQSFLAELARHGAVAMD